MKMNKSLEDYIKEKIKIGGPINIETFMSISLNDKSRGYYIKSPAIGRDNDFITAPEISQMFGELIAIWLLDAWDKIGKPKINIIELGPGNGLVMQDIVRVAKNFPVFLRNISLWLYEINEELSKKQEENIEYNFKRIESLEKLPTGINFIIANEFFDAIPIRQYIFDTEFWYERLVDINTDGEFCIINKNLTSKELNSIGLLGNSYQPNSIYETSPEQDKILKLLFKNIYINGGLLIFDYAKIIDGFGDTLQALSSHQKRSIFHSPGETDITAHVDYSRFIDIAKKSEISFYGPLAQNFFLEGMGIQNRYERLRENATDKQKEILYRQFHRLMDNDKMGSLFKALYFSNNKLTVPVSMI